MTDATPRTSAPLANVEFRALWFAEAQSVVGDQLTTVALAILVYQRTHSPLLTALVYALTFLPALAGGLGLAQLADRYPRRAVLVLSAGGQALTVGSMAIPGAPLPLLCVLVVLSRLVNAPGNAAQNALTREVFSDDELYLRSQDIRGITTNTAMLLGLAGGGLLVTAVGASCALGIDAITFLAAALVVRRWVHPRPAAGIRAESWFGAIRWITGQRRLRVLIGLSWLVGLTVIPEGLAAPLAAQIGAPIQAIGWLLAADPFGFVIGAYALSRCVSVEGRQRALGVLAIAPPATLIAFAARPNLVLALILLALAGATGAYLITVSATFITWVPNEFRGGAGGLYRTGLRVAQGVGVAMGGVAAEWLDSAMDTIAGAGVAGVLLAVPVAVAWSRVLRAGSTTAGSA